MSTCFVSTGLDFEPSMRLILSITRGYPTVITTTNRSEIIGGILVSIPADHEYVSGLVVRIHIPKPCGMQELDGFAGEITVIDNTSFSLNVDSTSFDVFTVPVVTFPVWADTCAQVVPIAENSSMLTEAVHNVRG